MGGGGVAAVAGDEERAARARVAERLREQAIGCRAGGSPLYAMLLNRSAEDVEGGGPAWEVLRDRADDTPGSALALRFMAAVHWLVLEGRAGQLAAFFPSVQGSGDLAEAWPRFRATLEEQVDRLKRLVGLPCQTNEVGRSAALLGGFLMISRETGLPFRLLELGASGGLNLRWDHFRYQGAGAAWGDPASPVRLVDVFEAPPPPLEGAVTVVERRGCDVVPLDLDSAEDRLRLRSSIWADQIERFRALEGAIEIAGRVPATVDRASAPDWIQEQLARSSPGAVTVVFHSVLLQYLTDSEAKRLIGALQAAGSVAKAESPLAWLRMEPRDWRRRKRHRLLLTMWPGGVERELAKTGPHGRPVRWLA
jgi:hypothetical protein